MKDYYEKSMRALQLAGMSKRTQQCYTRGVRQIVDFYKKTPDLISEVELEDYFALPINGVIEFLNTHWTFINGWNWLFR